MLHYRPHAFQARDSAGSARAMPRPALPTISAILLPLIQRPLGPAVPASKTYPPCDTVNELSSVPAIAPAGSGPKKNGPTGAPAPEETQSRNRALRSRVALCQVSRIAMQSYTLESAP